MSTLTTTSRTPATPAPPSGPVTRLAGAAALLATGRAWAVSAVVYAAYAAVFFGSGLAFAIPTVQDRCGQPPPDLRFTSSGAEVHEFLTACGPAGRGAYTAMQVADLVYPLVFATFIAASLALVLRWLAPGRPRLLALAALPFLASAFDYLENVCAWLALAAWPEPGVADGLLGLFSAAKTTTSWAAGILLLLALAALVVVRVRGALGRRALPRGGRP